MFVEEEEVDRRRMGTEAEDLSVGLHYALRI